MDFVVDAFSSELDTFSRSLDPAWIHQALNARHKASTRRRRLPAEQAIWLVLIEKYRMLAEAELVKCYQSYQYARLYLHIAIEKGIEDPDENTEYDSHHEQLIGELWVDEKSAKAIYEAQRTLVEHLRTRLEQWQAL